MKKFKVTVETREESLINQLKALPKKVKIFFGAVISILIIIACISPILSGSSFQASVINAGVSENLTDLTPRIMYWPGKVNQHVDTITKQRATDPDGRAGAQIPQLQYCKKRYPNTTSVKEYQQETISTWRNAGNRSAFTATRMSVQCVQKTLSNIIVSKQMNPNKELTSSALRLLISANGPQSITLTGFVFNNQIVGYNTTNAKIVVYKDAISPANIVGRGTTFGSISGLVPLVAMNNVIDPGTMVSYIVVLENATIDPTSSSQSWSVSLTDILGSFDVKSNNLPITETK